jgi:murein L,D-transpeptidase YcbB/YkuD
VVKSVRIERLLASTALGLALILCSHPGMAQQSGKQIEASVPMPNAAASTSAPAATPTDTKPGTVPADTTKAAPKPDAATPAADPAKAAVAPAATPAPVVTGDSAVSDKLRELVTDKKLDRYFSRKADREGAESYYSKHDFKPLWVSEGAADARAKAASAYIAQVDTVGLVPSDYPLPEFAAGATPDQLAEDELKFTASILTYARHAQIGQIHFSRVGADISFNLVAPEPAEVLAKLADTSDTTAALDSYNPPQQGFKALKKALAELRANNGQVAKPAEDNKPAPVKVGEGKTLRPGMKDARVVQLRARLDVAGDKNNPEYDNAVFEAVKAFQMSAGIGVDGMLGPNTVHTMNGVKTATGHHPKADPIDIVRVNMERWRWLPRKLGNDDGDYVMTNVPDYTLTLYHHGERYWHTDIVAGMPGKATPMITAEMKFITVNPTWNVPPSIIEHEYLPALQEDPNALDRIGLKLRQDPDGTVHISQPPGAGNALGRIRFNFPNKFLVYQHDTPDKYLFKREKRAYSHGCMRVENPLTYGEKLLSIELPNEHYTEARLEKMFGGSEININFPKPIPVHLTYQTAFVDQDGKLQLREDVYGRDAKMIAILKGSERKVADIAVERPPNTSSKPVKMPVGMYGGSGGGGPSFFESLFGGSRAQAGPTYYQSRHFIGPGGRYSVR